MALFLSISNFLLCFPANALKLCQLFRRDSFSFPCQKFAPYLLHQTFLNIPQSILRRHFFITKSLRCSSFWQIFHLFSEKCAKIKPFFFLLYMLGLITHRKYSYMDRAIFSSNPFLSSSSYRSLELTARPSMPQTPFLAPISMMLIILNRHWTFFWAVLPAPCSAWAVATGPENPSAQSSTCQPFAVHSRWTG